MLTHFVRKFFKNGALVVRLPDGTPISVGGASEADAKLIVHIKDNLTAAKIARRPGLAVGEAYMDGKLVIERGTLDDFFAIATRNLSRWKIKRGPFEWLGRRLRTASDASKARRNVAHHYDLSSELYALFLDPDRQYSCAYFPYPGASLEEAQAAKKRHLAAKLLIEPGQRVLDIGSGWGGLALTLAKDHGADVTGVTLSTEQLSLSRQRAAQEGLQNAVRFDLRDYRDVRETFDRIVSVGMFEHVGAEQFQVFSTRLRACSTNAASRFCTRLDASTGPIPAMPGSTNTFSQAGAFQLCLNWRRRSSALD